MYHIFYIFKFSFPFCLISFSSWLLVIFTYPLNALRGCSCDSLGQGSTLGKKEKISKQSKSRGSLGRGKGVGGLGLG